MTIGTRAIWLHDVQGKYASTRIVVHIENDGRVSAWLEAPKTAKTVGLKQYLGQLPPKRKKRVPPPTLDSSVG